MKKMSLLLLTVLLAACSNPEEEAKKLGFSDVAEMTALQKEGFKTKSEYTQKIEDDAKKLGFSDVAEMTAMQKDGYKTKAEYLEKIDVDKRKKEDESKSNLQLELVAYAKQCYASVRLNAAVNVEGNTPNAEALTKFSIALYDILIAAYTKEGMTSEMASSKINELYNSYSPSKLRSGDEQTDIGMKLISEHGKTSNECASILQSNKDLGLEVAALARQTR
jgi:hypothetical protein